MNERENTLRAVRFERPERIPVVVSVNPACRSFYPAAALDDLLASHPLLFPGFRAGQAGPGALPPWQRAGRPFIDDWGCEWRTAENGLTGAVVGHPLADWAALPAFRPPDPARGDGMQPIDWARKARDLARDRAAGRLAAGGLHHGHTFLRLTYLRGYENFIFDMADGGPRVAALVETVEAFNAGLVRRWLAAGAEWLSYPEDLGMQRGPLLSPALFRAWIKPVYRRLTAPARAAGCVIHVHSDGDIRALAADLVDGDIDVINLQDRVNGLDWIASSFKGRLCVDLDLDRQEVTRLGTPAAVEAHVRRVVETLGSPAGGLMLIYGLYPGIPLANARALLDALEKYATHFS